MKPKKKSLLTVRPGKALAPLSEGPVPQSSDEDCKSDSSWFGLISWIKGALPPKKHSDPRLLLGVLGCPLAPVPVCSKPFPHLSVKDDISSAQYITQQYISASGATKRRLSVQNSYAAGKVKMIATEFETGSKLSKTPMSSAESGWFVLWQMMPDKWYMELALSGSTVQAGSDGKQVWRCTPWLGVHAAKGPVRPPRRVLQGIDPSTTASIFRDATCVGEKTIEDDDCFVLKVAADASTLTGRSDGPAEIIRHVLFGYFSQKSGLLVYIEDSHLSRIHATGSEVVYWETTIQSYLKDYRMVEDVAIAHAGHSCVTLLRFGEDARSHSRSQLKESWNVEEVAFNVPGLSSEFFIPPADIISLEGDDELGNCKAKE